jgi:hypothetical protein
MCNYSRRRSSALNLVQKKAVISAIPGRDFKDSE